MSPTSEPMQAVSTDVPTLPGRVGVETLANGLAVCTVHNPQAPLVTCALWYRAGTRNEGPLEGGMAHFLEHMMFKGSPNYPAGEIDRRTQALGGSNNAFTSHDATAYYFNFASDRWTEALEVEADRMAGLTLDPVEVDRERQVILEEIAMYEGEPWDALELAVQQELFQGHSYGKPVLGTRESLTHCGASELAAFHHRLYSPENAVLVVAGDVPENSLQEIEARLGSLPARGAAPAFTQRPKIGAGWKRVERHTGEVARLLMAVAAPSADHRDHSIFRLLVSLLTSGRSSRLQRALVDELQLCVWVSGSLSESPLASQLSLALEVVPGVEPARVEEALRKELAALATEPPSSAEMDRARQVLLADWIFGHERVHSQALSAGFALLHFDLDHPQRQLQRALQVRPEEISSLVARTFEPEGAGVIGWSLAAPSSAAPGALP
ncbi:MAG: insulinase family protein [Deltaproteobacteria bacterium]|nr:insulinase family protein [Deltaproteobacteria bacterium]